MFLVVVLVYLLMNGVLVLFLCSMWNFCGDSFLCYWELLMFMG